MRKMYGRTAYEVFLVGDVPNEGCGQAKGMILNKSFDGAVKFVITVLSNGLGIHLTEVKSNDKCVRVLKAVGKDDYNFVVNIEEVNVIVEPPKKK